MARNHYIVLILLFGLFSCAQVGNITGGDRDKHAPAPIADKVDPPNETTLFDSKEVTIPFNEFIRLDNPSQNIVLIPPHAKIDATAKGKELYLKWEEDLQPNTTYSIYLNGAVKDITENNDSIIQYVFSTGDVIDTLSYSSFVIDAWSRKLVSDIHLAFFDPSNGEIVNFAKTNTSGRAQLNYLSSKEYQVLAFKDENRNLEWDPFEKIGFKNDGVLNFSNSVSDTIPFLLFEPKQEPRLRTFKFQGPQSFVVGSSSKIENESLYLNGEKLTKSDYTFIAEDSLVIYPSNIQEGSVDFVLHCDAFQDTSTTRISERNLSTPLSIKSKKKQLAPSDTLTFLFNDKIKSFDKNRFLLENPQDSTEISNFNVFFKESQLFIQFDSDTLTDVIVSLDSGAVICNSISNNVFNSRVSFLPERKFGILNIDLTSFNSPLICELILSNKTVRKIIVDNPFEIVRVEELLPGSYSFRIIRDENQNKKWDTGDFTSLKQPEEVIYFSKGADVRANWEIDIPLVPSN